MFPICRIGDQNQMGGVIIEGAKTVFAEFQPAAFIGSKLSEHGPWDQNSHPPHINAVVTSGSATVFVEFRPVARLGSQNSCGHSMTQGAKTIIVT
jgi:uncharacterized Zn-binding protein involved in type VI secretion